MGFGRVQAGETSPLAEQFTLETAEDPYGSRSTDTRFPALQGTTPCKISPAVERTPGPVDVANYVAQRCANVRSSPCKERWHLLESLCNYGSHSGLPFDVKIDVGLFPCSLSFLVVVGLFLAGRGTVLHMSPLTYKSLEKHFFEFASATISFFAQPVEPHALESEGFKALIANANVRIAARSGCADGAPWE